ncbi:hypothetical protein [Haliea sp. E17]|uniref:hypothetical protein n=1 Tax=Haliea sp. E17 TaxID=3401576 RepID=UPI003AAA4EBD
MSESTQQRGNRLVLLTIVGLPVTMFLTATWLWYYVANGHLDLVGALGTANRGSLVQPPRQIDDVILQGSAGPQRYADFPPKWTLAVVNAGARCEATCEHTLYETRQIHKALGKYFDRIDRLYLGDVAPADARLAVAELSDGTQLPESFASYLEQQHRELVPLTLAPEDLAAVFPEWREDQTTWYLLDPAGWVMMSYNSAISYKDVIADLKFLLKNSSE